jgi:hypothetical protein
MPVRVKMPFYKKTFKVFKTLKVCIINEPTSAGCPTLTGAE